MPQTCVPCRHARVHIYGLDSMSPRGWLHAGRRAPPSPWRRRPACTPGALPAQRDEADAAGIGYVWIRGLSVAGRVCMHAAPQGLRLLFILAL